MKQELLGALPRKPDSRDLLLGAIQAPVTIPASFIPDMTWFVRTLQGDTPACGAHGAAHLQMVLEHYNDPTVAQRYTPRFSWIKIKLIDGYPLAAGTDMRSIFKSLQQDGVDDFEPLENDVNLPLVTYSSPNTITPDMDTNAALKKINGYAFGATDFASICQHIYQNHAVALLIKCDDGFWGSETPTFTVPKYGHFIISYGYDAEYVYIVDSADPMIGFKKIAKEYFTPEFIIETGTAIDLPPAQIQAIVTTATEVVQQIPSSTLPAAEKINALSVISNFIQSIFSPKVGSSSSLMPISKPWYKSKTLWFNGVTIIVAVATVFGWTVNQPLFDNVTTALLAIAPAVNVGLRFFTKAPIASPISG